MAHTPGPWEWRGNNTDLRTLADKGKYKYGTAILALQYDGEGGWEIGVSEDDAVLMAAAPDMLEALKKASVWLQRLGETQEALPAVLAAIAKAEGNEDTFPEIIELIEDAIAKAEPNEAASV